MFWSKTGLKDSHACRSSSDGSPPGRQLLGVEPATDVLGRRGHRGLIVASNRVLGDFDFAAEALHRPPPLALRLRRDGRSCARAHAAAWPPGLTVQVPGPLGSSAAPARTTPNAPAHSATLAAGLRPHRWRRTCRGPGSKSGFGQAEVGNDRCTSSGRPVRPSSHLPSPVGYRSAAPRRASLRGSSAYRWRA